MEVVVARWWCLVFLTLLLLDNGDSQFCSSTLDNFLSTSELLGADEETLVSFPSNEVFLGDWIFPNSLRFECNETITGWVFRAEPGVDISSIERLPQWSIYRDHPWRIGDFELVRTTGTIGELEEMDTPGVYSYTLNFPEYVNPGHVVGVTYDSLTFGTTLSVLFRNFSIDGMVTPISYRRSFSGLSLFMTDVATEENSYMPLVAPIIAETPMLTEYVPVQTATLPTLVQTTQLNPAATHTSSQIPKGVSTVSNPQETLIITTTAQVSETTEGEVQLIIVGVVAGLFATAMAIVALVLVLLVLRRKKHHIPCNKSVCCTKHEDDIRVANSVSLENKPENLTKLLLPSYQANQQQEDMELSHNQANVAADILVESNKSYNTTTSVDLDQLYATVDEGNQEQVTENPAYKTTQVIPVESNQCYETATPSVDPDQLYATVEGEHQQQDMELMTNQAYASIFPVESNYDTATPSVNPDQLYATVEGEQQQDMELMTNQAYVSTFPVESNQTDTPSVDPDQVTIVEGKHQQQDMECLKNQDYTATLNIPVESNQCYGTTTPSIDQQQDMGLTENEAYIATQPHEDMDITENEAYEATPDILLESNESYGTKTPTTIPDQPLYTTVESI